jgi:hypothetical protein
MYFTVRRYERIPDPREAGHEVQATFVPLIAQVPGFVAYSWADAGGGVMVSTSVFEDRAGAEESNRRAADWVRQHPAVIPTPAQVTAGEVVAHQAR